mmetsp:Transcript_89330/g.207902  ORF Transcript_89330/g.207902 Transcript_89330/m.207902 type:complete len:274 (-) Transcript_89330:1771-2592(-)
MSMEAQAGFTSTGPAKLFTAPRLVETSSCAKKMKEPPQNMAQKGLAHAPSQAHSWKRRKGATNTQRTTWRLSRQTLLPAHGTEHAIRFSAMAHKLRIGLPQFQRKMDASVLNIDQIIFRLLTDLLTNDGVGHEAHGKGDRIRGHFADLILAFSRSSCLACPPCCWTTCWCSGPASFESVEKCDRQLVAFRSRQQQINVGEDCRVPLLFLGALSRRFGASGRRPASHGEAHEVGTIQGTVLVAPQRVQKVLCTVFPLAISAVLEDAPGLLGNVL